MKTLIFNGSPRPLGDTASLIGVFTQSLAGETRVIDAYTCGITPCVDCRYCWTHPACAKRDGMDAVYADIANCDGIVLASPVYFSQLTGPLLSLLSRLQMYYCNRAFRGVRLLESRRIGGVILVGGGDGKPDQAAETARSLLRLMGCAQVLPPVIYHSTNKAPALSDAETLRLVRRTAEEFNRFSCGSK